MRKEEILAVVLSRNYSTGLSVIRSLGTAGYTVDLVASAPHEGASEFISKSRFIRNYREVVARKVKDEDDPDLVAALKEYEGVWPSKPVLIAADDYTAAVADLHKDELSGIFLMPGIVGGEPGSLVRAMDKSVQGEIARRVGIKTPLEWVVSLREDDIVIPEEMVYPCYVKPLGSINGYKQEMARADDRDQLLTHLLKLQESYRNRSVLVQEFVNIETEYDLEGVAMDQEIVLPGMIWKEYVAQYDKGVPLYGNLYPLDRFGDFMEKVYTFLREFRYFGMFDLGFNIVDGEIWFNELNLRSGGTNYVYFESGCNLSEIFLKAALGEEISPEETGVKEFGKKYLYEKVAWDDYFKKNITREELDSMIENADIHIMVNDYDPEPGNIFNEEMLQEEKHIKYVELRNKCIENAMAGTGWDREFAREQIRDTRQRLGIGYKEYDRYSLWKYPPEEQEESYKKAVEKRERIKKQREECIAHAMDLTGWDRDTALNEINQARERLGVSYNEYRKNNFCLMTPEDQDMEYEKILQRKREKELAKANQ